MATTILMIRGSMMTTMMRHHGLHRVIIPHLLKGDSASAMTIALMRHKGAALVRLRRVGNQRRLINHNRAAVRERGNPSIDQIMSKGVHGLL